MFFKTIQKHSWSWIKQKAKSKCTRAALLLARHVTAAVVWEAVNRASNTKLLCWALQQSRCRQGPCKLASLPTPTPPNTEASASSLAALTAQLSRPAAIKGPSLPSGWGRFIFWPCNTSSHPPAVSHLLWQVPRHPCSCHASWVSAEAGYLVCSCLGRIEALYCYGSPGICQGHLKFSAWLSDHFGFRRLVHSL